MIKVFVDTDVVLDLFLDRQPYMEHSAKIFQLASNGVINLFTSVTTFTNSFYILSKLTTITEARKKLIFLESRITSLNTGHDIIKQALHSKFQDFEDAVQHFTAKNNNMDILVTRNLKDYKYASLPVQLPEIFLVENF